MTEQNEWPVWADGEFLPPGAPAISPLDPGFLLGLAVFETLLCEDGRVFFVEEHLDRLRSGAAAMGIQQYSDEVLRSAVVEVIGALAGRTAAVRVTLTPGAPGEGMRVLLTSRGWSAPPEEGVGVLHVPRAKICGDEVQLLKTNSRARHALALEQARACGAWEALLGTDHGDVSEGTMSNLFIVREGQLCTPPLDRGCLAGIIRGKVLELAANLGQPCTERPVELDDLRLAEEVFLTSSLVRILPVVEIPGLRQELPRGPGPRTRALQQALAALERVSWVEGK